MGGSDDDLAVHYGTLGQTFEQRLVQLRKVAIERPEVTALDVELIVAAEDDGAKPIPLRFVQEIAGRELFGELGEHRFDGRWYGKSRRILHCATISPTPRLSSPSEKNHAKARDSARP